ncbi:MAG TPA: hypothetical protein H9759_08085 [Candidatus Dietzia intestinipullorum]|nr:hypothetical protein [Candidatus Dietzia intestinipullorum]
MRKRLIVLSAAVLCAAAGCATDDSTDAAEATTATTSSATTATSATAQNDGPEVVEIGTEHEIPCSASDATTCMTFTVTDVRTNVPCDSLQKDQAIAMDFEVTMPAGADSLFTSPFRSFPWSTYSSTDEFNRAQTAMCNGDSSVLNVMAEFPGGNTKATVYLDAPTDVRAVVFEPEDDQMFLIETGA